jgi:class 3 adenylate cyclase
MNEYLSAMSDIVESNGGFVDKYIGDAIVAVFGAPLDDARHASNAVQAALKCAARLPDLDRVAATFRGRPLRQRIGLNTGDALVGNIGSGKRFNYTVMGDTVNLASRLEGANRFFGTTIIAAQATMAAAGGSYVWREIDAIRVKHRENAVRVFEPLAAAGDATPDQMSQAAAYAEGLARYRARDFAAAAAHFARIADADPPAAVLLQRTRALMQSPPAADWEPVTALEEK